MRDSYFDRETMHRNNVQYLLMTILHSGEITVSELANITGISLMTVTRLCSELQDKGLIQATAPMLVKSHGGGRPSRKFHLNHDLLRCGGLHLGTEGIQLSVVDSQGTILDHQSQPYPKNIPYAPSLLLEWVGAKLNAFLEPWVGHGLLSSVGVSVSGIVDPLEGSLIYSANLGWRSVAVAEILETYSPNYRFYLQNDTKAIAVAEYLFGQKAGTQRLVLLSLGNGIGSAPILNGSLYGGNGNHAGEIGHVSFNPNGKVCECGQVGCLQTYLSRKLLLEEARRVHPDLTLSQLVMLYQKGDPFAKGLVTQFLSYTALAINLLANMYAPDCLLLTGRSLWECSELKALIADQYSQQLSPYLRDTFQLCFDSFGANSYSVASASIGFMKALQRLEARWI